MLTFKPRPAILGSPLDNIIAYIRGEVEDVTIDDSIAFGIQDTQQAIDFSRRYQTPQYLYRTGLRNYWALPSGWAYAGY